MQKDLEGRTAKRRAKRMKRKVWSILANLCGGQSSDCHCLQKSTLGSSSCANMSLASAAFQGMLSFSTVMVAVLLPHRWPIYLAAKGRITPCPLGCHTVSPNVILNQST